MLEIECRNDIFAMMVWLYNWIFPNDYNSLLVKLTKENFFCGAASKISIVKVAMWYVILNTGILKYFTKGITWKSEFGVGWAAQEERWTTKRKWGRRKGRKREKKKNKKRELESEGVREGEIGWQNRKKITLEKCVRV